MEEFIHIGFSKCASTYLQSLFNDCEEINYVYKSKRFSLLDVEESEVDFSPDKINLESDEHIILPSYHPELNVRATRLKDVDKILSKISNHNPNSKIILVIRNHLDLIKSRYTQYIIEGGTLDIKDFIIKLNGNFDGDESSDYFQNYYYKIIKEIESKFSSENLLVLLFEDLKNDKENFLKALNSFVSINFKDKPPTILSMRKGLSKSATEYLRKLNNLLVVRKRNYLGEFKTIIPNWCYIFLKRIFRIIDYPRRKTKPEIPTYFKEKIQQKFKSDNQKLSKYLNKNINDLGYHTEDVSKFYNAS